ncbi:MAG: MerR family transcriptional regulator [Anaerolineae bacterium]|nr:MerR family transcriptional regulator [Anaerolineae bacterium]
MASILDLSDTPIYTIKSVALQTGIRPVTLRAWERRHDILSPFRSDNRYRLYSERDIALLRWIKNRLDSGLAISNVANELHSMIKDGIWPDMIPAAPIVTPGKVANPPSEYSRQLFEALIRHDEARSGDLLREIHSLFDLPTTFMQIITPVLVEIGEAWFSGKIRITTEHFVSAYLRGKLLSLLQAYPSRRGAPYLMLGCAPTEQHEIGSLMLSVLLRSEGYRVEYLGADVPLEDLTDYASYEHPAMIVLAASMIEAAIELKKMSGFIKKVKPLPVFGFGGAAFRATTALKDHVEGVYLGDTLIEAVDSIHMLLPVNSRSARTV